jgi:hypothetical protein
MVFTITAVNIESFGRIEISIAALRMTLRQSALCHRLSIMTHIRMTTSVTTLRIMTLIIMTFSTTLLSLVPLSIKTLGIMSELSITAFSIVGQIVTIKKHILLS